jgi:hypothetical protein
MDLTRESAVDLLRDVRLDLIKRGADGSLIMSADRWFLVAEDVPPLRFRSEEQDGVPTTSLEVDLADVERLSWDRLPKQQARSQVRVHFCNGDVWTFSGLLRDDGDRARQNS